MGIDDRALHVNLIVNLPHFCHRQAETDFMNVQDYMAELGRNARAASRAIVAATTGDKNNALLFTAEAQLMLALP